MDPLARLRSGFEQFKTNVYEYVFDPLLPGALRSESAGLILAWVVGNLVVDLRLAARSRSCSSRSRRDRRPRYVYQSCQPIVFVCYRFL
jgi:hypothetical protein